MSDELANAGTGAVASEAPISGGQSQTTSEPASQPSQSTGFKAAFDRAQSQIIGDKPAEQGQQNTGSQQRAANGKFAPREGAQPVQTGAPNTNAAQEIKALEAPARWPQARRDIFAGLAREQQQAWLDHHNDWDKGFQKQATELTPHKQFAEQVKSFFTDDLRASMQKAGMDELAGVKHAVQLVGLFNRDPIGFIQQYMQRNKIDGRVFLQGQTTQDGQAAPIPLEALAPILNPLRSKLETLEAAEAQRTNAAKQTRNNEILGTITQMMSEADTSGTAAYPHMERVHEDMIHMFKHDPRFTAMDPRTALETAYKAAVYATPELREELVTAEVNKRASALEQQRTAERLSGAATVKPTTSATGAKTAAKGFAAAFENAKATLGKR